jgi:hypothetical protein
VDYIIDKHHIDLTDYGLEASDSRVIQSLMTGDSAGVTEKIFLWDIVANKRNGIGRFALLHCGQGFTE